MSENTDKSISYLTEALRSFSVHFLDERSCQEWFIALTFPDGICCPKCKLFLNITPDTILKNFSSLKRYTCENCNHRFSVMAGTILHDAQFISREFYLLCLLLALKVDAKEIGRILKVHPDTIKFWQRKIKIMEKYEILG